MHRIPVPEVTTSWECGDHSLGPDQTRLDQRGGPDSRCLRMSVAGSPALHPRPTGAGAALIAPLDGVAPGGGVGTVPRAKNPRSRWL